MAYKQKVLGAIPAPGSEKNYKYLYIKHMMDRVSKIFDQLPGEGDVTKIIALRDESFDYVEDDAVKAEFIINADKLAKKLKNDLKTENDGQSDNSHKIEANRIAAIRGVGWVLKYFDGAWGWSRKRGILTAGPFGDGRRRFLPLSLLPPDGRYLLVDDDYEREEGEFVHEFKLRRLLMNNIDDDKYTEARNDRGEEEELQDLQEAADANGAGSPEPKNGA